MNFEDLKKEFPELLAKIKYASVGDGWLPLVRDLLATLYYEIDSMPGEIRHGMTVMTIKEKFGKLRVYMEHSTPALELAIDLAERISGRTCEKCGNVGTLRNNSWRRTLCDADNAEWVAEKERRDRAFELRELAQKETEKDKSNE